MIIRYSQQIQGTRALLIKHNFPLHKCPVPQTHHSIIVVTIITLSFSDSLHQLRFGKDLGKIYQKYPQSFATLPYLFFITLLTSAPIHIKC